MFIIKESVINMTVISGLFTKYFLDGINIPIIDNKKIIPVINPKEYILTYFFLFVISLFINLNTLLIYSFCI